MRTSLRFISLAVGLWSGVAAAQSGPRPVETIPGMPPVVDPTNLYSEIRPDKVSPAVSVCAPVVKASFVGVTGAVTVRLEVADLPLKLPVTVWEPVAVAVHVAPVHEPFGEIVNVVEDVTLPRLLLKTSNAVVV